MKRPCTDLHNTRREELVCVPVLHDQAGRQCDAVRCMMCTVYMSTVRAREFSVFALKDSGHAQTPSEKLATRCSIKVEKEKFRG